MEFKRNFGRAKYKVVERDKKKLKSSTNLKIKSCLITDILMHIY